MSNWQPIETAPQDGTAVWLLLDNQTCIGFCDREFITEKPYWVVKAAFRRRERPATDEIFGTYAHHVAPTHWMPLPVISMAQNRDEGAAEWTSTSERPGA